MILIADDLSNSASSRSIQTLTDQSPDGVIFTTASMGSRAIGLLLERGVPTVLTIRSARRAGVDVVASGALDACARQSIRVPEDLSIVGVNDTPMSGWTMISLTTVRREIGEIGILAARRIVARIERTAGTAAKHDTLPTNIIVRKTSGPPSCRCRRLADAAVLPMPPSCRCRRLADAAVLPMPPSCRWVWIGTFSAIIELGKTF